MRIKLSDGVRLFVDFEGTSLRIDESGLKEQPTLILLHGGPGYDHTTLKPYFSRFCADAQVMYYDHRGMGRSDLSSPENWNLSQWAQDLHELIGVLGITRPIIFGQSFGGFVALQYAAEYENELGGLILSSTAARMVEADCLSIFEELGDENTVKVAKAWLSTPSLTTWDVYRSTCMPLFHTKPQPGSAGAHTIFRPEVLIDFQQNEFFQFDFRETLAKLRTPTLIIAGEEDPITPKKRAQEMIDCVNPDFLSSYIVSGAGHGVFRDDPHRFDRALRDFIRQLG